MAQTSLPQAGESVGDSGPYTADDWAKLLEVVFTGDQATTQGVLRHYLNELEVTNVGNIISINTGGGFCYGRWLNNDASIDITATACAGVETRWDRVVLVQNATAAAYNTNLLLPAAYPAGVPRNSCRIAILRGTCGSPGVLPALLTGPNYYMVELARYQVTGGTVGTITDYRDYCNFSTEIGAGQIENRTRQFWVPALIGWNYDTTATISLGHTGSLVYGPYITLPDDDDAVAEGRFFAPTDYASDMTVTTVLVSLAAGNIYGQAGAEWGRCGQLISAGVTSTGLQVEAVLAGVTNNCVGELTIGGLTTESVVLVNYRRKGANLLDTIGDAVFVFGFIVEYTADS